jgi:hypothetical protein
VVGGLGIVTARFALCCRPPAALPVTITVKVDGKSEPTSRSKLAVLVVPFVNGRSSGNLVFDVRPDGSVGVITTSPVGVPVHVTVVVIVELVLAAGVTEEGFREIEKSA